MTIEERTLVEIGDLVAVQFECRNCGAFIGTTMDGWANTYTQCPGCRVSWVAGNSPEWEALESLRVRLQGVIASQKNGNLRLRFELRKSAV